MHYKFENNIFYFTFFLFPLFLFSLLLLFSISPCLTTLRSTPTDHCQRQYSSVTQCLSSHQQPQLADPFSLLPPHFLSSTLPKLSNLLSWPTTDYHMQPYRRSTTTTSNSTVLLHVDFVTCSSSFQLSKFCCFWVRSIILCTLNHVKFT